MSPKFPKTPIMHERREQMCQFTQNMSVMSMNFTPPSGITKFIAQNPFEADLTSRLHLSMISPTVFNTNKIKSSNESSPAFRWTVDELARCQPAKIDELLIQQNHVASPQTEKEAQDAIRRFFTENQIVPSPMDTKPKDISRKLDLSTPTRNYEPNSFNDLSKTTRDVWTQTILTLPSVLPKEVEEALKPFFTFTQEQNVETEDANCSNSSLRRKLFDFQENADDDESDADTSLSSYKSDSPGYIGSPLQSGILADHTPLRSIANITKRDHGTPMRDFRTPVGSVGSISSINLSPICTSENDRMSCQSIRQLRERPKSATRLDFAIDMSIDEDNRDISRTDFQTPNGRHKRSYTNDIQCEMPVTEDENQEFPNKKIILTDYLVNQSDKIHSSTMQQFNSQNYDAGYQTCSMSNMETNEEDTWSDNARHIYCSTPSKNHIVN